MKYIAHRGMWNINTERNTMAAFDRAFQNGFGVETDVRDYSGQLVISHDIASEECIFLETFLKHYKAVGEGKILALNIKADGISALLKDMLFAYGIEQYFVFDMSVPEMVLYRETRCKYYTRQSDIETTCVMYKPAYGVWIDAFNDYAWLDGEIVKSHLAENKNVGIVSPELHGMDKERVWRMLKEGEFVNNERVFLCTDTPLEAKKYMEG